SERSEEEGIKELYDWLEKKDISIDNLSLQDGSGLAPQNRITALALAQVVKHGLSIPGFRESLPRGKTSGSARYLFRGMPNGDQIWVKSGYIQNVRTYSGLAKTSSGKEVTFCFMLNNFSCSQGEARKLLEKLMHDLTNFP
ncbi:MAG: hypothetical protein HKN16_00685, partial [Saprospiraceae bacterium]|nr:hypothetical protein [Saprospiraceae bacterium]